VTQIILKKSRKQFSFTCKTIQNRDELRNANVKKDSSPDENLGPDANLGLFQDSFLTCDAFTFNVTWMAGPPSPDELKIRSASQWAILSRDLVEDLVDQVQYLNFDFKSQNGLPCNCVEQLKQGVQHNFTERDYWYIHFKMYKFFFNLFYFAKKLFKFDFPAGCKFKPM
jgi:hypothetical protein